MPTMRRSLSETCEHIAQQQVPNFLRLYLNPYVTQTCFCLDRYVRSTWPPKTDAGSRMREEREESRPHALDSSLIPYPSSPLEYQTFLANGFEEALGGSIKLARYACSVARRPTTCLVLDFANRLGAFANVSMAGGGKVEFIPGIVVIKNGAKESAENFGLLIFIPKADHPLDKQVEMFRQLIRRDTIGIICVDRDSLAAFRRAPEDMLRDLKPDIVVFDESFVNHDVPFGAFTARRALYQPWNRRGKTTFHSTTFQPNTISSLHFMRCLEQSDPEFHASVAPDLEKIQDHRGDCKELFRKLYSPALYRAICATGFDEGDVRATGDFVFVNGHRIFDCVSGVACSIRGHNPPSYVEEIDALPDDGRCRAEIASRLQELTGLECMLPAVSGATAVENALKLALIAQFPRRHVLALHAGFGGKTLLSLVGTANPHYKEHIDPLYPHVSYVDPFAPDAKSRIEQVLAKHSVALLMVELIQAVGGVRRVPEEIIRFLADGRRQHGYLLLIDEVQTGMYRTGPFSLSIAMGLSPDFLTLGKGTSDMMFPFSLTLYSASIQERLDHTGQDLSAMILRNYGYDFGYRTVLNVLRQAEELCLEERVARSSALFRRLLEEGIKAPPSAGKKAVREVRVYGLLIGIELDAGRGLRRWFRKRLFWFYIYSMLWHPRYPVLVGFCQYEPNVLKITPPLTVAPAEIEKVCATINEVLRRPFYRLLAAVLRGLIPLGKFWRKKHEHDVVPTGDAVPV
jgi:acetylornithine/succinyldiaminopimelate/putrescine aminotransferase